MESTESLQQFYTRTQVPVSPSGLANANAGLGHFNVFPEMIVRWLRLTAGGIIIKFL